jgi:CheY-like chemotaxis protein
MSDCKPRILIVDDEPDILWSLSLLLETSYDVATAEDGRAALREVEQSAFEAIILDLMMPVMDGAGFKRALDARGSKIPVIIVSAFSDVAERARDLGVEYHLAKPIDVPRLEAMLAQVTRRKPTGGNETPSDRAGGDDDRSAANVRKTTLVSLLAPLAATFIS